MNPILSPGIDIVQPSGAYLLRDEFSVDVAAGSVDGTAAVPGPGTRKVVDTESKLTIAGGNLMFAGGKAAPEWGDPATWFDAIARVAGRIGKFNVTTNALINTTMEAGFSSDRTGRALTGGAVEFLSGGTIRTLANGGAIGDNIGAWTVATEYNVATVLRATGLFVFVKGGAFTAWALLSVIHVDSTATIYPAVISYNASCSVGRSVLPLTRWLPTPLVSDGFGSTFGTSDGLGHAEGVVGGIGAGGSGVTFSNAGNTWSVSGGKAINTPTLGVTEFLTNGNFETGDPPTGWSADPHLLMSSYADQRPGGIGSKCLKIELEAGADYPAAKQTPAALAVGTWYKASAWRKITTLFCEIRFRDNLGNNQAAPAGTSWAYGSTTYRIQSVTAQIYTLVNGLTPPSTVYVDDASIKALTFSELVSLSNLACADVLAGIAVVLANKGEPAGLALNWDSTTNPQNGVLVYFANPNGSTQINVDKCVAGTWSNVSTTTVTYSAGARLVVVKNGTEYRVYYNNALVVANTITDAGIITNTLHGLFSTDPSNTFDDLTIYATGSSGEYNALNAF